MGALLDHLLNAPPWAVYLLVPLLVFVEDALFVGFVIPGETAAILGGVLASHGHTSLVVIVVLVVLAAISGDSVGYEVGRHAGQRLIASKRFDGKREQLDKAQSFLARRGGVAVFLGRFVAFLRAVMPALAGTARMRYLTFLLFNAAGGLCWGVAAVLLGYFAGDSYKRIASVVGRDTAAVVLLLLIIGAAVVVFLRKRAEARRP